VASGLIDGVHDWAQHKGTVLRTWVITRGAFGHGESSPAAAAVWGVGRVLMNEHPELHATLVDLNLDLDSSAGQVAAVRRLEAELLRPDGLDEIVLDVAGRQGLRLQEVPVHAARSAAGGVRLDFHLAGQLRNLVWLPWVQRPLGAGEVELEVRASGLNFRDVMYLMGLLPDEAVENGFAGASLGLECAGVVTRVAPGVHHFRPGDRVMGFGASCFASHVQTRADALAHIPEGWSFEEAATVPTVFFTVYYALCQLADLQPGERVLIHGGAGGVGIAAIQLARHLGAEVFATAGSDEKRDFVRLLGADRVFDSRSLAFADEILACTDGEGVDVILNSLAGEAIRRNLRVLKPFGRFLELGKRDFFENTAIGLRPFKDNISYFGIDADQLLTGRPALAARVLREVMSLFAAQALTPLPCRVFPARQVVEAFRAMQQARHIGKIVLSMADAGSGGVAVSSPGEALQPLSGGNQGSWLVSGGLAGLGQEVVRWLVDQGVPHLVLLGRRGLDTPGVAEFLSDLKQRGVQVQVHACDVADACALAQVLAHVRATLPPLRGVVHGAAVFDDGVMSALDASRVSRVVLPKVQGAWNLHQATRELPLEHFVLFSSVTTAIGNPGQANYVAANMGLEALARLRLSQGLPALCVGWGPIGDAGYLARNTAVRDTLAQRMGKAPLTSRQALNELGCLMAQPSSHRIVANLDWRSLSRWLASADSPRFAWLNSGLAQEGEGGGAQQDFRSQMAGLGPAEAEARVRQLVTRELAQILGINPERIDPNRALHDLGLDSLMAVELALALEQRLGIQLPVMLLNEAPTVHKVSRRILERLQPEAPGGDVETAPGVDDMLDAIVRQHGEAMTADERAQVVQHARTLAAHDGLRSTP
jgi:NADPH:quinone reductase-like Zn-dependent oxidoreductase/acyl carrier protein